MALFKPFRGSRASLDAQPLHDGYAYFCIDDGTFHIDYVDAEGNLQRKQLNAKEAETFGLHTPDEFLLKEEIDQTYTTDSTNAQSGVAVAEAIDQIKEMIVQPDYEQHDSAAQDYIKNRPFYHTEKDIKVSLSWDGDATGKETIQLGDSTLAKVGEVPAGLTIETIRQLAFQACYMGTSDDYWSSIVGNEFNEISEENGYYIGTYDEVSEFDIVVIYDVNKYNDVFGGATSTGIYLLTNFSDGSDNFYLATLTGDFKFVEMKQIDEKFIPDTIARVSAITEINEEIKNIITKSPDIIATFNIEDGKNYVFTLLHNGKPFIDWGNGKNGFYNNSIDGIPYDSPGLYTCKIYNDRAMEYDFSQCEPLTSLIINGGTTSVKCSGSRSNLTSIKIDSVDFTMIKSTAFMSNACLSEVELSECITEIGTSVFVGCKNLRNIIIPASVTSIDENAFAGSGLESITFKNLIPTSIQQTTFNSCSNLEAIYVPQGCVEVYKAKWATDGVMQDILDKIVESDRTANMSDIDALAPIAKSGSIEDLLIDWDTVLIFDGGDADTILAVLDDTVLE